MRASENVIYLGVAFLLLSINLYAGAIGLDPELAFETRIHKVNTFSKTGKDPLVRVTKLTGIKELSAIGMIKNLQPVPWPNGKGGFSPEVLQSTGFLISPCLVMTVYHSVFGFSKSPNQTDFSIEFTANRTVIGKPITWRKRPNFDHIGSDWVIVKLDEKGCLGAEVGFLKMLDEAFSKLKNPSLITAGFPGIKENESGKVQLWAHLTCSAYESLHGENYVDTIFNDCATSSGQSGSPLLVRNNDGEIRYVGMQATELGTRDKTYRKFNFENANVGVDLVTALTLTELDLIEADVLNHAIKSDITKSK